jgi:hypothetical protein
MVRLKKKWSRVTARPFAHYEKPIVVTLLPGDLIAMHLLRTRTRYEAPIAEVFRVLAGWHAEAERARKRDERRKLRGR